MGRYANGSMLDRNVNIETDGTIERVLDEARMVVKRAIEQFPQESFPARGTALLIVEQRLGELILAAESLDKVPADG